MLIFYKKLQLTTYLSTIAGDKVTIGFVPTMGALHLGHLSLIKESLLNNELTVVSVFVNPTQFNNPNDLSNYPRTLEKDVEKIKSISSKVIIYAPTVDDIYEKGAVPEHFNFDGLENTMEGQFRPGHFNGVGTVVKRLFNIVKPTNAYFGEKDFQQVLIIKKLVKTLNIPVNVIICPVFREPNGLAMSSRNERLSEEEKNEAALIYKTIQQVKIKFKTESVLSISNWVKEQFKNVPNLKLEYFQIADETFLLPCKIINTTTNYRAFIAVYVNNIRLIDTISLN
ncbi:pantoate--beta-alanine ligase [Flavobacterium luteum]|uniref:Pantothenate synthetase n=1 Tax=Flavobacterium luteum TaxID=2026654 RepID=A0A7J5AHC7_9FLAO|nr:pantoate--beta-alanine ligase [Flavobacterium luteum]KAB1156903.1 pantoate--beta-alanine ligase [Flavobacterium luteum]